jgi:hypothetical protein
VIPAAPVLLVDRIGALALVDEQRPGHAGDRPMTKRATSSAMLTW